MIKIRLDFAVSIYLIFSLLILILWFLSEKRRKVIKRESKDSLWQCPICFYVYINSKDDEISQCPRCGSLHKRGEE
ncbi:MAG TPA: hypothetical protein ENF61_01450 [Firmicutes bacterium]|nr:MAG: hypothetical protein DRP67_03775 [Candidatus Omnitrophota bacterium]HDD64760.1 hypothetical protein [Bacillota bacterium]